MAMVSQEQLQPGQLIHKGSAWQARPGAKLRLKKPVPSPTSFCKTSYKIQPTMTPHLGWATRGPESCATTEEDQEDLGPLAPDEALTRSPAASSAGCYTGSPWFPSFSQVQGGYRAQPFAAGVVPPPQPGTLGFRRWDWPTSRDSSMPLPGTLVFASDSGPEAPEEDEEEDLPPLAPPQPDDASDAEAPSEAPASEPSMPCQEAASDEEASENEAPSEGGSASSSGEEAPSEISMPAEAAAEEPVEPDKGPDEAVGLSQVSNEQSSQAVDNQANAQAASFLAEDGSADERPKEEPKEKPEEEPKKESKEKPKAVVVPPASKPEKTQTKQASASNKAPPASFLSDDEVDECTPPVPTPSPSSGRRLKPTKGTPAHRVGFKG